MTQSRIQEHPQPAACWCGSTDLRPFSGDYLRCARCETLVLRTMPRSDVTAVGPDEAGLYGKDYWFNHQENDVGFPNLTRRSRADGRRLNYGPAALACEFSFAVDEVGEGTGG